MPAISLFRSNFYPDLILCVADDPARSFSTGRDVMLALGSAVLQRLIAAAVAAEQAAREAGGVDDGDSDDEGAPPLVVYLPDWTTLRAIRLLASVPHEDGEIRWAGLGVRDTLADGPLQQLLEFLRLGFYLELDALMGEFYPYDEGQPYGIPQGPLARGRAVRAPLRPRVARAHARRGWAPTLTDVSAWHAPASWR